MIYERADVGYAASTLECARLFATPKYPLRKLGELCSLVQYGCSALASAEPKGWPIIRMNNLQQKGWDFSDLKYYEPSKEEAASYRVGRGDILFNRTNGSRDLVGKCELFDEPGDWLFASYLIRIRVNRSMARPQFISQFLNTRAGRALILRSSRQILMSNINAQEIRALDIPLPGLKVQEEFEAKLTEAKTERERKLAQAEALVTSLDGWLLEQLGLTSPPATPRRVFAMRLKDIRAGGRLDVGFNNPSIQKILGSLSRSPALKLSLGTICPEIVGGATPTKGDASLYDTKGVKFLRILNIRANEFDLSDLNFIRKEVHEGELRRSRLSNGDVLMTITGRVGTAAVVTPDILPANINQHIVRLRVQDSRVRPDYLAAFLNTSIGLALSNRGVTGGTRIALDYETVRSIPIPIPACEEQTAIVAEVVRRRDAARRLRAEAAKEWTAAKAWFEEQLLGAANP